MAYADSDDMVDRYDDRSLKALTKDDGTDETDLSTNDRMTQALSGASGQINSAILIGKKYDLTEVAAMTGDDLAFLKDIVCGLAIGRLMRSRGYAVSESDRSSFMHAFEESKEYLEQLKKGDAIFNIDSNLSASKVKVDGPTTQELDNLNLPSWQATGHLYPGFKRPNNL